MIVKTSYPIVIIIQINLMSRNSVRSSGIQLPSVAVPSLSHNSTENPNRIRQILFTIREKKCDLQNKIQQKHYLQPSSEVAEDKHESEQLNRKQLIQTPLYQHLLRRRRIKTLCSQAQLSRNSTQQIETHSESGDIEMAKPQPLIRRHKNSKKARRSLEYLPSLEISKEEEFLNIFLQVPKDRSKRNNANTLPLAKYLEANNMFFMKINHLLTDCFLKLNKLVVIDKGKVIYRCKKPHNSFYIILMGKVKLYSSQSNYPIFKKVCKMGQSFGEELLFAEKDKRRVLDNSKTVSRCFLLEVKIEEFDKMREEMFRFGLKSIFLDMESLLKRNLITKNWERNEACKFRSQKSHK